MAKSTAAESPSLVIWASPSTRGAGAYQLWENYKQSIAGFVPRMALLRGHDNFDTRVNPQMKLNFKSVIWAITVFRGILKELRATHVITSISQSDILYGLFIRPFSKANWTIYVLGQPYPVKHQTNYLKSVLWRSIWVLAAKRADRIIGVSNYISSIISEDIPGLEIKTVYPSLADSSLRAIKDSRFNESRLSVGFVGRFSMEKDPGLFCSIMDDFQQMEAKMFGDGPLRKEITGRIKNIELLGFTPQAEIYSNIDFLMMTSRSEGLPMVLVEASYSGVVPLVADVGGCAEAIHPENRHLLVIPKESRENISVWRQRLQMLVDSELRAAVLEKQKEWAVLNFDMSTNSRLLATLTVPEVSK